METNDTLEHTDGRARFHLVPRRLDSGEVGAGDHEDEHFLVEEADLRVPRSGQRQRLFEAAVDVSRRPVDAGSGEIT